MSTDPTPQAPAKRKPGLLGVLLGVLGELLMTAGILFGLFAFWQIYWTTWQMEGGRTTASASFQEALPNGPSAVSTDVRTTPPPVMEVPGSGEAFANLHFPRWDYMVVPAAQGVTPGILDHAYAGHYPATAMPGEVGNSSFAAHRRSYGNSFRRINELAPGDPVIVETKDAWLVFHVTSHQIVPPTQGDVIQPVPGKPGQKPTERLLTLTTCHPEYGNSERFIVHAKFAHWVPRASGIPAELAQGGK